jgi:hypothetical protein
MSRQIRRVYRKELESLVEKLEFGVPFEKPCEENDFEVGKWDAPAAEQTMIKAAKVLRQFARYTPIDRLPDNFAVPAWTPSRWERIKIWWWKWNYRDKFLSLIYKYNYRASNMDDYIDDEETFLMKRSLSLAYTMAHNSWLHALAWYEGDLNLALAESARSCAEFELLEFFGIRTAESHKNAITRPG